MSRIYMISCSAIQPELDHCRQNAPPCDYQEFGLHLSPSSMNVRLQSLIDQATDVDLVILGYGRCGNGTIGLHASHCPVVIPRVDDCLALLLGSREAYLSQYAAKPGTYYFTQGWIDNGDDPLKEYRRWVEKYAQTKSPTVIAKAETLTKLTMRNYTRVVLLDMGLHSLEPQLQYTQEFAGFFGLDVEIVPGSLAMLQKTCRGPWGADFITIQPGETITADKFE